MSSLGLGGFDTPSLQGGPDEQRGEELQLALIRDLLHGQEEIVQLPFVLGSEFLDASWTFAVRLATLTHERLVRKKLTQNGWALMNFEQDRRHRPDFLAHNGRVWLLVAARVEPGKLKPVRERLAETPAPFSACPVIVIPDHRSDETDHSFPEILPLRSVLERELPDWTKVRRAN